MSDSEASISRLANCSMRSPDSRDDAAQKLWGKYANGLLGFIRFKMDDFTRSKTSPESILQMTFEEVFRKLSHGEVEVEDRTGLLSLLRQTAERRLIDKAREVKASKRTPNSIERRSSAVPPLETGKHIRHLEKITRAYRLEDTDVMTEPSMHEIERAQPLSELLVEASPHVRICAMELFDALDSSQQLVFLMWIQQYTPRQIACRLDVGPTFVELLIKQIKAKWSSWLRDE